ncbi:MAG: lysophospholipid acyltransferase family protein [Bdellovibrionales bacterium]|nr:lysophospholipid acyltransferase family protein [Bdellovibrionales bacterium]
MQNWQSKLLLGFCYIIFILPYWMKNALAWGIAILWFDILRIRRKVALENLKIAFPEMTRAQQIKTARLSLLNMGQTLVEFTTLAFGSAEDLQKTTKIIGEENVREALAQNKGALLLGLHLANGDYGISAFAQRGFPAYVISKRFTAKWLDKLWFDVRGRHGTKFILPRNSSYDILKALKSNGAVIFVLDQYLGPPIGTKTTFFGKETGTGMGLALFAHKTQAPVIPCYAVRKPHSHFEVHFEKPIPFEDLGDKNATLQFMTQKYTDKIQDIVTQYPEQWMWIHRRWKKFQ